MRDGRTENGGFENLCQVTALLGAERHGGVCPFIFLAAEFHEIQVESMSILNLYYPSSSMIILLGRLKREGNRCGYISDMAG